MSLEFILKCKVASRPTVEFDIDVPSNRKRLPVGRERVICDGVVEQVVDFWTGHLDYMR